MTVLVDPKALRKIIAERRREDAGYMMLLDALEETQEALKDLAQQARTYIYAVDLDADNTEDIGDLLMELTNKAYKIVGWKVPFGSQSK